MLESGAWVRTLETGPMTLSAFEMLLRSIPGYEFEPGDPGPWRGVRVMGGFRDPYGCVTASPKGDHLCLQFYGLDWEKPENWKDIPEGLRFDDGIEWEVTHPPPRDVYEVLKPVTMAGKLADDVTEALRKAGALPAKKGQQGCPGRKPLSHDQLIMRLAYAQEGEELKMSDPQRPWKDIAGRDGIHWPRGTNKAAIKLLEDARHRLHRYEKSDPAGVLDEVARFRKEKRKIP